MKKHLAMLSVRRWLRSTQGRNLVTYLIFVGIAVVLWMVQVMSEETQRDLRCRVVIVNVPDSLTRITPMPEAINVSVRARGTALARYVWSAPQMSIDYNIYHTGQKVAFGEAALKSFFRNRIGNDCQIQSVTPDSLSILYTSQPGTLLPVKVEAKVVPGPQYALIGAVRSLTDSVTVFGLNGVPSVMTSVSTARITLNDVRAPRTLRIPLDVPSGYRAVPDSVDIHIDVEPLVSKIRKVTITPAGVPKGQTLILNPMQADVYYMVPMSVYKQQRGEPQFTVEAQYSSIRPGDRKVAISITHQPKEFLNIYLDTDSVEFVIEQH